jgi:adenylate kinase
VSAAVNTLRAVFLGAPGAGKGTQAKRLSDRCGVVHISTGDMLRSEVARESDLGKQAQSFMNAGRLVPDDLIIAMVASRVRQPDATRAWILDGFPRTLPQAEALDRTAVAEPGLAPTHVVYFAVPAADLVQRLSGRWTCSRCGAIWNTTSKPTRAAGVCDLCSGDLTQRADDRPDAVRKRLDVYETQTAPLLSYYRSRNILMEIDAARSSDEVFQSLLRVLEVSAEHA